MGLDDIVKIEPKKKKKTISVTIDPSIVEEARAIAKRKGVSLSNAVQALLEAWVESNKKLI